MSVYISVDIAIIILNHSSPPKHSELPKREFFFVATFALRVSSFGQAPIS